MLELSSTTWTSMPVGTEVLIVSRNLMKFHCTMARLGLVGDLAGSEVQCCEQVGDAVTDVVMGAPLDLARTHRQRRLCAVEGLDAGLLVDAEDDRMVGWVHVEPHDIADLLHKHRIFGQFERIDQPWFQSERSPDPTN